MKPRTRFVAFSPATASQIRAKETNSTVTVIALPCAGTRKVRKPSLAAGELGDPRRKKKITPEQMRARPDARWIIELGRVKFLTTVRTTISIAKRVR